MRNATALGLVLGAALTAGAAQAGSFTFTSDTDWNQGTYASTFSAPPGPAAGVQLNEGVTTRFDFIWVALSGRDSIARIDTNFVDANDGVSTLAESAAGDGAVKGEYYTRPSGMQGNPSRTTVDLNGDVWVGNRNQASGGGSVAKVALDPGAGPTSSGVWNGSSFDRLDWTNAGNADSNGGVTTAADTAIKVYARTASTNNRTIAIDANNDVWVGGLGNRYHQKLDGDTGAQIGGTNTAAIGGYGGVIDGNGVLWSSDWANSRIGRYDTTVADPASSYINAVGAGGKSYGLAVDLDGNIWNSHYDQGTVSKISSDGTTVLFTKSSGGSLSRGVAITPDNNAWIANSGSDTVTRLDTDGNILQTISVGDYPTGLAVDSNGKVWVTNQANNSAGNSVMRIDPTTNMVDLKVELGANAAPYNYSDMTGSVVGGITNPTGTWSIVLDGGADLASWDKLFWNTEAEGTIPVGATIMVELRTADSEGGLGAAMWMEYASNAMLGLTDRWIEVRATLTRDAVAGSPSPILSDLTLTTTTSAIPLPASWLLLASGAAGLAGLRRRARKT